MDNKKKKKIKKLSSWNSILKQGIYFNGLNQSRKHQNFRKLNILS